MSLNVTGPRAGVGFAAEGWHGATSGCAPIGEGHLSARWSSALPTGARTSNANFQKLRIENMEAFGRGFRAATLRVFGSLDGFKLCGIKSVRLLVLFFKEN